MEKAKKEKAKLEALLRFHVCFVTFVIVAIGVCRYCCYCHCVLSMLLLLLLSLFVFIVVIAIGVVIIVVIVELLLLLLLLALLLLLLLLVVGSCFSSVFCRILLLQCCN